MDTEHLRLFLDSMRTGSFAAAAREHGIDPSQVSRAVAGLEASIGARLLNRTTRRLSATEAGERWLEQAPALLDGLDRLRDESRSDGRELAGTVRLTASVAFAEIVLLPLWSDLRQRYPRLGLELLATDANVDLIAERVDLAVRLAPAPRADLTGIRLRATRYRVVASPDYVRSLGAPREPAGLSDRESLLFALPDFRERWRFRDADGSVSDVPVRGSLAFSGALPLRRAAILGLGPALLADWLIGPDLDAGALIDLFPDHEVSATTFDTAAWLLHPGRDWMPRRVRAVRDFLVTRLTQEDRGPRTSKRQTTP